ncbi:hypothetical protein ABID21_001138 [Pseudorhizobium tarimense]|uniref:Transposase n=1 Tax=Pseudorhizobium tarimense TaxID=1079109 RepID=A0ABV2H3C4_9HYPH
MEACCLILTLLNLRQLAITLTEAVPLPPLR